MKKYNIILKNLSEHSLEDKQIIYEHFAKEFAISVSGASIMLKHLPTLLEIDVDQKQAQKYVDFFNKYGGTVELKERKCDSETFPPIPVDEPQTEIETVVDKPDAVSEGLEEIQDSDEKETVLEDESIFVPESLKFHHSESAESEDDIDIDSNEYIDIGIGIFRCPSCGLTDETLQETCPICNTPMVQEKPKARSKKNMALLQPADKPGQTQAKKTSPFVVVTPSLSSYPSWKKELSTITTETLIVTSLASYISLIMFIFSKINIMSQLIFSFIPFGVGVLLFITGRIYMYFKEKLQRKETISKFAEMLRSLLAFPGGKIAEANHGLYKFRPELFGRKYIFLVNGFLFLLILSSITAPKFLHNYDTYFAETSSKEMASKKHRPDSKVAAKKSGQTQKGTEKTPQETGQSVKDNKSTKETKETKDEETVKIIVSSIPRDSPTDKKKKKEANKGLVGKKVRITLKNNFLLIGFITSEASDSYTMESFQYGGRFSFSIFKEDISKIAIISKNKEDEKL